MSTCSKPTVFRQCRVLTSASVSNTERTFVLHTTSSTFTIAHAPCCVLLFLDICNLSCCAVLKGSPATQPPQPDPCVLINLSIVEEYDTYEGSVCSTGVFGEVGVCLSLSSVGHPSLSTPVLLRNLILLIQPEKRTGWNQQNVAVWI